MIISKVKESLPFIKGLKRFVLLIPKTDQILLFLEQYCHQPGTDEKKEIISKIILNWDLIKLKEEYANM